MGFSMVLGTLMKDMASLALRMRGWLAMGAQDRPSGLVARQIPEGSFGVGRSQ